MIGCASISARSLAECAAIDGIATVAADLFGDVDTCRYATQWQPLGASGSGASADLSAALRIDPTKLLDVLSGWAQGGEVRGWVAGSGFDGAADLLEAAAERLPLFGTAPANVRRVRDPRDFFGVLRLLDIAHPSVRFEAPATPAGWLSKDAGGCGGWQVLRATDAAPAAVGNAQNAAATRYWQAERAGVPMSATFIGNGRDAVLLGFNLQTVRCIGERPFVFCGVIGPVRVSEPVRQQVTQAARALSAEYRIAGLASLDFLLDGDQALVLELNPRPPASAALYRQVGSGGPFRAHLRACLQGELPAAARPPSLVQGQQIVFAARPMRLDERAARLITAWPGSRDQPRAGSRFGPGDPVCSLSASGASAAQVGADLARQSVTLQASLETLTSA